MKPPREWSVYLVRCSDESLYTGIAKDVVARITAHNAGRGAAYTRSRRPVDLVYHKKGLTRSAALVEEARIKSLERAEKLAFLKKAARGAAKLSALAALLWSAALPARATPSFVKEAPVVLSSAVPQAFTGENTLGVGAYTLLRMYYLPAISSGTPHASSGTAILSATSTDGLVWAREAGVRVDTNTVPSVSASSITGCALQPLTGGGFRMLYSIISTTGAFRIHSATSADGLAWANEATTVVDGSSGTYVGVPRLVVLNSGDWRLYYTRDVNGGNDLPDRQIFTARSTDQGATWGASSVVVATVAYEAGASKLTDGRVRLYYSEPVSGSSATVIMSALSTDALGTTFAIEAGTRLSTSAASGALGFPVPVRSTDSFCWRLYYSYWDAASSTGDAHSALTAAPAPVSLTPPVVFQTGSNITMTIAGEIFSPAPSVALSLGGAVIAGGAVNRVDDETITATFATQGAALGSYDLTVTNADGTAGVFPNALLIDFAPGSVNLTGNLLRPRDAVPTTITVTLFAPGRVSARIYDLDGRPVRTLFDDAHNAGVFNLTWDGKNAAGASVPSGLYFVAVSGPKLTTKSKIVVIR